MKNLSRLCSEYKATNSVATLNNLLLVIRTAALRKIRDVNGPNEDAVQELLIHVWQHRNDPLLHANCSAFVQRAIRWRILNEHRRRLANLEFQVPEMFDEDGERMTDDEVFDLLQYRQRPTVEEPIEEKLESIEDPFIREFALLLWFGHTQSEAANLLRVKPATARKRISRFRRRTMCHKNQR